MVTGLPLVSCIDGVCAGCVLDKQNWDNFDKCASWHASTPLQLVHSDLYNGGAYVNNQFTSYCTAQGIQMQHIVPYTPQHSGVVERKNRTLKEMANCMVQSKGLSLKYWVEAINCENYIVNQTPTKTLKNITLEESWTKLNTYVSHFQVFGSVAWVHILEEKRKALQPKSEKCIFVGHSEDVKSYRLLQQHCNEIIIRRDVKFDENLLACEPNLTFMPSSTCEPNLMFVPSSSCEPSLVFVPYFVRIIVYSSSLDDDNEDENPPLPAHLPPDESIEPEPTLAPLLPRWVPSTREVASDLVDDPLDQRRTCSQFQ
jgi:hypothetical protein